MRARGSASILSPSTEFLPPLEHAHDDKEMSIRKKTTPEFRRRDRRRHGRDHLYGKDADHKSGGPRYVPFNKGSFGTRCTKVKF
jgi:hypothetical protein